MIEQTIAASTRYAEKTGEASFVEIGARTAILRLLARLKGGCVAIEERGVCWTFGDVASDLRARIVVRNPALYRRALFGGTVGAGESYMDGEWSCDDLTALVRIMARNRRLVDRIDAGWSLAARPARALFSWLSRNTRTGSRKNIGAHYDLGNDFFELFLDRTMSYSSAIFENPAMNLEEAQIAKLDHLCRKLELQPSDHLIEIGTGWGGLALHAASKYGCRVTTTTISREQYDFASKRIAEAGLGERVTVLLRDYRDLEGEYDKLVSVEMIEAVGREYYDSYFAKCNALLKPGGRMVLQGILMPDQEFDRASREVDFIKRYIFPGGCLPSVHAICDSLKRKTQLRMLHLEDLTAHYAKTLQLWRENLHARREEAGSLGYGDRFLRMWNFYLCYCEGGFAEEAVSLAQLVMKKSN